MASSLAHDLAEIAQCYEAALLEVEHEDSLEHTAQLLERVDHLLANLQRPARDDQAAWRQLRAARDAHQRLLQSAVTQRAELERLQAAHREGRRALAAYGSRLASAGTRVVRDA